MKKKNNKIKGLIIGLLFGIFLVPIIVIGGISIFVWRDLNVVHILTYLYLPGQVLSETLCRNGQYSLTFLAPICGRSYISWYIFNIPFWGFVGYIIGYLKK